MGAAAMAQCSCCTWTSPFSSPTLSGRQTVNPSRKELRVVFEIDVALSGTSFSSGIADTNLPMTGHLTLSSHAPSSSAGDLHQLPLVLLKRLLLEFLGRRSNCNHSELVIAISSTTSYSPLELVMTSSTCNQRVRVIFEASNEDANKDFRIALSLLLCARCGASAGCCCGWRQRHVISPDMELHEISRFIAINLVPMQAKSVCHLQFGWRGVKTAENFGVQIHGHNVQRQIVESPYTVFKMGLCLGDLTWRIARRYREFAELHARLKVVVQEGILPALPPTKWFAATDHGFLVRRQWQLENYIKGVFMVDELQDSVPLLVFLGVLSASYVDHVALRRHRRQILHLQVLEYYTRPGDLILFNGRAKVSALQRSLTRAEWDHVAIVVPSRDGGHLQLLEVTGDGVTLSPLTSRLLAYSTFHVRYFALRKLRTPLLSRAVVNDLLERFTAEVEGLSYGLSLRRLLHARQTEPALSRDSTFFCSELVAHAYKALGLISSSSEANDFWPGSFSPGDFVDAELGRHGASLSPEIIIDCKLLEVATATKRSPST
ncbi:hypothetical protein PR002_g1988 [Phytophthora rubi]|uniref:PX domain-containing protein n=1 Tax=Phytophthora rubi TaxID=129364 RepID=A0A6A3NKC9_9STRA|nr:hypothetical protein PR002_g1988 [Phytophthora rubi]